VNRGGEGEEEEDYYYYYYYYYCVEIYLHALFRPLWENVSSMYKV
jgi:hypothetical protein